MIPSSKYWKFRRLDHYTLGMLINQKLWFSRSKNFNDPFDTDLELSVLLSELDGEIQSYARLKALLDAAWPDYRKSLDSRFVFCVNREEPEVNRPFEEVLMWSHYADEHRGICIGFSMEQVLGRLVTLRGPKDCTVYYGGRIIKEYARGVDRRICNGFFQEVDLFKLMNKFSFVKSENWRYENEHRFVTFDEHATGAGVAIDFDGSDIECIIFGLRTSSVDRETVKRIIKDKGWGHIKVFEAVRGKGLFELVFEQVEI